MRRIVFFLFVLLLTVSCGTNAPNGGLRFLNSINVQPATGSATVGNKVPYVAMGTFSDGKVEDLSKDGWGVTWEVGGTMANPVNWATIDANGVATCIAAPASLTVEAHSVSFECQTGIVCPQIAVAIVQGTAALNCN